MQYKIILHVLLLLIVNHNVFAQGLWTKKADFGEGNSNYSVGFSIGSKGYIGTGRDSTFNTTKSFWEYDPSTDIWSQKADFGGIARTGAVGFSIGGKGYIGTGTDGTTMLNDFWEYDPTLNLWTQKANFSGTPRHYATGFSVGGKGYIGTGDTTGTGNYVKDFWEYDPIADNWISIPSFPGIGRGPGVGFSIGSKGYFGTGNAEITDLPTRDFWEYDPALTLWTRKADLPIGKCAATGFSLSGKGYIGTGEDSIAGYPVSTNFWEYDPIIDNWTQKADFGGIPRKHAIAFSIGAKGYLGTGIFTKDFWEFDPNGVGINETVAKNIVSVYPNPMRETATFQLNIPQTNNSIQLLLYDLHGNNVKLFEVKTTRFIFNRGGLSTGTYIFKIVTPKGVFSQGKLVIID